MLEFLLEILSVEECNFIRGFLFSFQVKGNLTVSGIDFYASDAFGEGLYESCKDVKFGTMNTRALNFIGAGAQNFTGDFLL